MSGSSQPKIRLDHLVYVVPDLEKAMDEMERESGVRPEYGGKHPTFGTQNALLALGGGSYIELLAPDPEAGSTMSLIGVDGGRQPRIATFCCDAGAVNIDTLVARLQTYDEESKKYFPSVVQEGRRRKEDNTLLSWRFGIDKHMVPWKDLPMGGAVPFFIDWGDSDVRPGMTAPRGCTLLKLEAYHPQPDKLTALLDKIGYGIRDFVEVRKGLEPRLKATVKTQNGGLMEIS